MKTLYRWGSILAAGVLLAGCGSSDRKDDVMNTIPKLTYSVHVQNLTYAQPMSPVVVAYHDSDVMLFEIGKAASVGLEKLAEGGDNSAILTGLMNDTKVKASKSGAGLIKPSKGESIMIEGVASDCISVATMLVNTNDAFAGVSCVDVSEMKVGEKKLLSFVAYDAGTEENSEMASTIPGPAGGGEGFNSTRDDFQNFVRVHSGIVSKDDGLSSSDLTQNHKWSQPVGSLVIQRMK